MARTYKVRAIVLRKTKLAEKDLIITLLCESGEIVRAVAKGARKPGGSFAARTELFSVMDCMLAQGRKLDVLSEARLAKDVDVCEFGLEQATCASAIAELVCTVAQEGLEQPRLFDMTLAALATIATADPSHALAITAACLLKVLAISGFRPSLNECVSCGDEVYRDDDAGPLFVSFEEGGVVCESCRRNVSCMPIETTTLEWIRALLKARFAEISTMEVHDPVSFSVLQFTRQWSRVHTGRDIRSLDFLFTAGLY